MPRGASEIPDLRLERLNKLITTFMTPPNLLLSNLFGSVKSDSSTIKWESMQGNRGMTPFVPPGAPAPRYSPPGVAKHSAEAAYWKEKIYYDEEFLNNLRKEGTESQYLSAKSRLARDLLSLRGRCDRRKEWMIMKMITSGSISYLSQGGVKISVDYELPSDQNVTLTTDYKWESGTKRDILRDIMDAKIKISKSCNGKVDYALCNSTVLKFMALDPSIQTLLQKMAFGDGNLFKKVGGKIIGVNTKALGNLLDIDNFIVYDEQYVVTAWLTANVTADSTTDIYVDDVTDFEEGGTLRFHDVSAGTYEDETISSVNVEGGYITVSAAPSTSYKAGEDKVTMTKPFLSDDKFTLFASKVDGQPIAEYKKAPFGLDRHYGIKTDTHEEWDPEGVWIRVQNKGLPVLYQRDAIYNLTVN